MSKATCTCTSDDNVGGFGRRVRLGEYQDSSSTATKEQSSKLEDGCVWAIAALFALPVYYFLSQYILMVLFGRDFPWYYDVLAGFVFRKELIRLACACYFATMLGWKTPFFPQIGG
jgi:hypothetical protein